MYETETPGVRDQIITTLGRMGPGENRGVPLLQSALEDPESDRLAVFSALVRIRDGSPLTVQGLVKLTQNRAIMSDAIEQLGRLGGPASSSVPVLAAFLGDERQVVRLGAAIALSLIEPDKPEWKNALSKELVRKLPQEDFYRVLTARAFWAITRDTKTALPIFTEILGNETSDRPYVAVIALGEIGPEAKETVPLLIRFLKVDGYLGVMTARTLGRIGPGARLALPDLQESALSSNVLLRRAAKEALARIGGAWLE
jgi:HEAT repeat protein